MVHVKGASDMGFLAPERVKTYTEKGLGKLASTYFYIYICILAFFNWFIHSFICKFIFTYFSILSMLKRTPRPQIALNLTEVASPGGTAAKAFATRCPRPAQVSMHASKRPPELSKDAFAPQTQPPVILYQTLN